MHNKLYDILKYAAIIGLPAISALYLALAQIWGLPKGSEIAATITAFQICLGTLLCISNAEYAKAERKISDEAVESLKDVIKEMEGEGLHDERAADIH